MFYLYIKMVVGVAALAARINTAWGVPLDRAYEHAAAAVVAASDDLDPYVVIAVAKVESSLTPTAVSRVQDGTRTIGQWRSITPGPTFDGPYFCGPMQAKALSWKKCLALRNLAFGYTEGTREIRYWLGRSKQQMRLALQAHGCGNAGLTGACSRYSKKVFRRLAELVSK